MRKMKDSRIEWIGEIPEDWEVVKVKNLYSNNKLIVGNKVNEYERLALTLNGVIKRSKKDADGLQPEKFEGYQILKENELVFKLIDLENVNTSRVGLSHFTGIVSPAYIVLNNEKESKLGYYYFLSMWHREIFNKLGGAGVRSNLNSNNLLNLPYLRIDKEEQELIADYLDEKVQEIDNIISKTQKTIEEYKKYKQSVITEAVTKGLNPNVEMKDSGIEWIGEIPRSWEKVKFKYIIELNPKCKTVNLKGDSNVTFTPMDHIKNGYFINKESKWNINNSSYSIYEEGDIVIAKVTPCFENGNISIMKNLYNGIGFGSSELFVLRCGEKIISKFLLYYLQNNIFKNEGVSTMTGTGGLKRVSSDLFRNYEIELPKLDEQNIIAEYLDKKCTEIDTLISKKQQLITELQEYKKSLIYECVTGKKEVVQEYAY